VLWPKVGLGGGGHWSGPRGEREKGKLSWQRRIGQERFRIFKILFFSIG
jgi:hypothetical protein